MKCVAQAHTTRRLTRSNAFATSSTRATAPKYSSPAPVFEPLHLHQHFPNCLLSSSISAVNSVSINTILLLPLRHFWCPQGFPPAYQRGHQRNRPLTCNVLLHQEEHRRASLLRPFFTLFHLCVSFVKSSGTLGGNPSQPTPVLPCTISILCPFALF